jgi:hypothetical protein
MNPTFFSKLARLLQAADPNLTPEDAATVAAAVGDTPRVVDGEIRVNLSGRVYKFPERIYDAALR